MLPASHFYVAHSGLGPAAGNGLFARYGVRTGRDGNVAYSGGMGGMGNSMNRTAIATLVVGESDWPFPVPIVFESGKWTFDLESGREEIINRRVGENELSAIHVC